jgi:hemoglobin
MSDTTSDNKSIFEILATTPEGKSDPEIALTKIRSITKRFYELMDTRPEAHDIRIMHPEDLSSSEQKLFEFLVGWLGGPPLFEQKYGHPRLRARHLPFKIGIKERDQWLLCMHLSLQENPLPESAADSVMHSLARLADHMRNVPEAE